MTLVVKIQLLCRPFDFVETLLLDQLAQHTKASTLHLALQERYVRTMFVRESGIATRDELLLNVPLIM